MTFLKKQVSTPIRKASTYSTEWTSSAAPPPGTPSGTLYLVVHVDHTFLGGYREGAGERNVEGLELESREEQGRIPNQSFEKNGVEYHRQDHYHKSQQMGDHIDLVEAVEEGQDSQPRVAPVEDDEELSSQQVNFGGDDSVEKQEAHHDVGDVEVVVDD